jgi:hypothetical protein
MGFKPTIPVLKTGHVLHCAAPEINTGLVTVQHNPSKHSGNYTYRNANSTAPNAVRKLHVLTFVRFFSSIPPSWSFTCWSF